MIYRTFRQGSGVAVGPGDDCAALDFGGSRYFLAATDQLVSDVHYIQGKTSVADIAKKLFNRNVSDIAAMGGTPAFALLTVASRSADKKWYSGFIKSIWAATIETYRILYTGKKNLPILTGLRPAIQLVATRKKISQFIWPQTAKYIRAVF